ncbi:hypothetical protein ACL02S_00960 [Nocardia sp. 004]|uniref:hypothetical protein n=1 Tax=Nocardia sp. 004 TaxID=3385978 RepID=UPI00399FF784
MLDVSGELVEYVSRLLAAERRVRGTCRGSQALTCWKQPLFLVMWLRKQEDIAVLGAGFDISRATADRYHGEGVTSLAAQAPDLREALALVASSYFDGMICPSSRDMNPSIGSRPDRRRSGIGAAT